MSGKVRRTFNTSFFFILPFHRGGTWRQGLSSRSESGFETDQPVCLSYFYLLLFLCSTSNHLIPFQVVDRTTIPYDFSLSMIGLLILWIVMGRSICAHFVDFGFGSVTHFAEWKCEQIWHQPPPSRGFNCVAWFGSCSCSLPKEQHVPDGNCSFSITFNQNWQQPIVH